MRLPLNTIEGKWVATSSMGRRTAGDQAWGWSQMPTPAKHVQSRNSESSENWIPHQVRNDNFSGRVKKK
ncbi:MAG: hypothetical protein CEE38_08680 [Planctomycetes bacterium B3_Pla]|nr:MAG: hypothetical protein CEE38_08680 [Planctomycetes bacterium B3_Pla]